MYQIEIELDAIANELCSASDRRAWIYRRADSGEDQLAAADEDFINAVAALVKEAISLRRTLEEPGRVPEGNPRDQRG